MRGLIAVAFIVLVLLGLSPNVHAVPTFTWERPWAVTLNPMCANSQDFACLRSGGEKWFGKTSVPGVGLDGVIVNTNADQAIAGTSAFSSVSGFGVHASVTFSRPFTLSDGGIWDISLFGHVDGHADFPPYTLTASAAIGSLTVTLDSTKDVLCCGGSLFQGVRAEGQLPDGSYLVTGQLSGIGGGGPFDRPAGFDVTWTVGLSATPVPEPATLTLLALGLLMLWRTRTVLTIHVARHRSA